MTWDDVAGFYGKIITQYRIISKKKYFPTYDERKKKLQTLLEPCCDDGCVPPERFGILIQFEGLHNPIESHMLCI